MQKGLLSRVISTSAFPNMFKALLLKQNNGKTVASIEMLQDDQLPAGDVSIDVSCSSLNYKDGLAITDRGKIVKSWPLVPGIDFCGSVSASSDERYKIGDKVILTGWGVGESHWGGMAQKARAKGSWLVKLPAGLQEKEAMVVGTAGLTAMLSVMALQDGGVTPNKGPILVTGASGGVGSVSVQLLSKLGYEVAAVSGRPENTDLLKRLGASHIISRDEMLQPARPLEKQLWAGAIDVVGDKILAKLLSQIGYNGTVAICGLAGGFQLPTTVMPFILRNVRLQGIDSVSCPQERREEAWKRLVDLLPKSFYEDVCQEIPLEKAIEYAESIVNGEVTGRVIVNPNA